MVLKVSGLASGEGTLQELFQALDRDDTPFSSKIQVAYQIAQFNQRQVLAKRQVALSELEITPTLAVLEGLLRWLLRQLDSGSVAQAQARPVLSAWKLLVQLFKWTPNLVLARQLTRINFVSFICKALNPKEASGWPEQAVESRDIASVSRKRKRDNDGDHEIQEQLPQGYPASTQEFFRGDSYALFLVIADAVREIQAKLDGDLANSSRSEQEYLKKCLASAPELAAEALNLACGYVQFNAERAPGDADTKLDDRSRQMNLQPFILIWELRSNSSEKSDETSSISFCSRCLSSVLALLSSLYDYGRTPITAALQILVEHHAIEPMRKKLFSINTSGNEEATHGAIYRYLSSVQLLQENSNSSNGLSTLTSQPASTSFGILFSLALRKLPPIGASRREAEQSCIINLFSYFSSLLLEADTISKISSTGDLARIALKELVSLCDAGQLRVPRPQLQKIMLHILSDEPEGTVTATEWTILRICMVSDPEMVTTDATSMTVDSLTSQLFARAGKVRKKIECRVKESSSNSLDSNQDAYETVVSVFALSLVDVYVKARKLPAFLSIWAEELTKTFKPTQLPGSERSPSSMWADIRVRAAVAAAVEPSLRHNQLQLVMGQAGKGFDNASSQIEDPARLFSASIVLSTIVSGISEDSNILAARDEARDIHSKACTAILLEHTDRVPEANLWVSQLRLLEKWPDMFVEESEHTESVTLVVKKAKEICKHSLGWDDPPAHSHDLVLGAFTFLWMYSELLLTRGEIKPPKHLPSAKLLGKLGESLVNIEESAANGKPPSSLRIGVHDYVAVVVEHPKPLAFAKSENLLRFLSNLIESTNVSLNASEKWKSSLTQGPGTHESLLSIWSCMSQSLILQEIPAIIKEMRKIEAKQMEHYVRDTNHASGDSACLNISKLAEITCARDWREPLQEAVMNALLETIVLNAETISDSLLSLLLAVLLSLTHVSINISHPRKEELRAVLEKRGAAFGREARRGKTSKSDAMTRLDILGLATQRLFDIDNSARTRQTPAQSITDLRGVKKLEATVRVNDFANTLISASPDERVECIRILTSSCKQDVEGYALAFVLQICNMRIKAENRSPELKVAISDLITELTQIASLTRNPRRATALLRCLAVALRQNAWAMSQHHIEDAISLVVSLTHRRGSLEEVDAISASQEARVPQKSKIDLPSAKRMLLGSLGIRVPKTKADEDSLRQRNGAARSPASATAEQKPTDEDTQTATSEPVESKLPSKLYTAQCNVFSSILQCHRIKLGGRWHLVLAVLRAMLGALFQPYNPSAAPADPTDAPWLSPPSLTPANAGEFSRLLEALCDPTPSSVRPSKKNSKGGSSKQAALNDETKKARAVAGRYSSTLLKEYCRLRLAGTLAGEKRTALSGGLYAIFDAMPPDAGDVLNELLTKPEREIFKGVLAEWKRDRKWHGR